MLTLALLRHAKSSWDQSGRSDFDRPLSERGQKAAPEMGDVLRGLKFAPDVILCSPSIRTRQTLDLVLPRLKCAKPVILYDKDLYHVAADGLLEQIRHLDGRYRAALVVGHNPGLHAFALQLAGQGATDDLTQLTYKFPTAALAIFSFTGSAWTDIAPGKGWLEAFAVPEP